MHTDECLQLIRSRRRAVITTHVHPDGDAIGSEIALARALVRVGMSVNVLNHDDVPSQYRFLDPAGVIRRFDPARDGAALGRAEVIFVLDANHPSRLGALQEPLERSSATMVCIDHHLDPTPFGHLALVDPEAAATGEILFELLVRLLGTPLPAEIAEPLYVAIMTDTGSFRFPQTDPPLHRLVAQLLEWGADPVTLYQRVYEEGTPSRLRLLGEALASLSLTADGRIASLTITREMFGRTGTTEADTENFINYTLTIKGVEIGLMFTELEGVVKVSFRSKGEIWVNRLAQLFGGNGHKNAAGAKIKGEPLDVVVQRVISRASQFQER